MVVDNGLMDDDGGGIGVRIRDWIETGFACVVDLFFLVLSYRS